MIDREGRTWAAEWMQSRANVLQRRKIVASGLLIDSFQAFATQTLERSIINTLEIAFEEHGRYIDMKRLNLPSGGTEYISNLAAWIESRNLQNKYKKTYLEKARRKSEPDDLLLRMAWALAFDRAKNRYVTGNTYRRRAWYSKAKAAGVSDLFNRVAANVPKIVAEELTKAFPIT